MRVLATVVTLLAPPLALARVCRDPCLEAARTSYVECRQGATEELASERQLCRDGDPACVQACAARQEGCSTTTGIGAALETCLAAQQAAIAGCRNRFQRRSRRRGQCVDNARIDGFQCRNRARTATAPERRQCRADFDVFADGCGPGEPPRGARVCQRDARRARSAGRLACDRTANADKSACTNKDAACAESCRDARTACDEPGRDAFASAVAACDVARRAAAATCEATNPAGSDALDACLETADTDAFLCRDAARTGQAPAFAACVQLYVGCVRACPAA